MNQGTNKYKLDGILDLKVHVPFHVPFYETFHVPFLQFNTSLCYCFNLLYCILLAPACGANPSPQSFEFIALFFVL